MVPVAAMATGGRPVPMLPRACKDERRHEEERRRSLERQVAATPARLKPGVVYLARTTPPASGSGDGQWKSAR